MGKRYHDKKKGVKVERVEEEVAEESESKTLLDKLFSKFSVYTLFLALILIFMLYVRMALPYDSVFLGNYVNFAADDAVYHMRLVENTLAHFPSRIFYDPFTHYPFGSYLHFGPMWTILIATLSIMAGARTPTDPVVYVIGAYLPAVLGALLCIPVYYIGKYLYNRKVGFIAALTLAVLPGQFLSRTVIGFTDHHVAEIFFSTLTITFFIFSFNGEAKNLKYDDILNRNWSKIKKALIYPTLAGIMFAFYLLSWPGAPLFVLIIMAFIGIQSIALYLRNEKIDHLIIAGMITLIIPLIALIPIFTPVETGWYRYGWFHVLIFFLAIVALLFMGIVATLVQKFNLNNTYYPISIMGTGALIVIALFLVNRTMFAYLISSFQVFVPSGGSLTISEVQPMLFRGNQFTLALIWYNFGLTFLLALIALILIARSIIKNWRASETLFLVWSLITIWASISQNRFGYYPAINIAVLTGYFGWKLFDWAGVNKFFEGFWNLDGFGEVSRHLNRNLKWKHIFIVLAFIFIAFYPTLGTTIENRHSGGTDPDWINSLMWMRNNTPDPGIDYYGTYKEPNPNGFYDYPKTAYGVMSWWDYGHIITYIAHRIPNANPFQAGIIEQNWTGAAPFLTAENETEANRILDFLGTRYVISDAPMATGKFWAIGTFAKNGNADECYRYYYPEQVNIGGRPFLVPSQNYFNTTEIRLHYFDGDRLEIVSHFGEYKLDENYMGRYRLVYESPSYGVIKMYKMQDREVYVAFIEGFGQFLFVTNSTNVATAFDGKVINYIKIFEYVKGARIRGEAPVGVQVNLTLDVASNQGRAFVYKQHTISNGTFEFVVPYSNTGPIVGGTNFAVKSPGSYRIEFGNTAKEVIVTEKDVMDGNTISI